MTQPPSKSQIGHTKAAAGVAGLIKAALAVHHKVLPPTLKVDSPLPGLADGATPFYLTDKPRPWLARKRHPRRAAVSAFGFGGSNFHAVIEEYKPTKPGADWDGQVLVVALGAESRGALETRLAGLSASMSWDAWRVAAYEANRTFAASAHRLVLVIEKDKTDVAALLANAKAQLKEGRASWQTPDGAYYGSGSAPGGLAVLFPGQGAQYVGMGRDWSVRFPALFQALAAADAAFALGDELPHGARLSDRITPPTAFTPEALAEQEAKLRDTRVAQPAIGAISLGAYHLLESFGLKPDAVAGHSYGELTALAVAGRLSEAEFFALSCLRGSLMAEGQGDRGTMLAVAAPLDQVRDLVERHGLDVVLANKNAPTQVVLSGATAAIEKARAALSEAGLKCVPLPVAAAFHSPLVAEAQAPLREALQGVAFPAGTVPVYANTTGGVYPEAPEAARDLLAGQLAAPVEFVSEIAAMHEAGIRTFLEVGPGARLSGLVRQILDGREHQAIALDASNGRRDGVADLGRALAQLAAAGYAIDFGAWEGGEAGVAELLNRKKPAMTVPISGANYRTPQKPRPPRPKAAPAPAPVNGNGHAHGVPSTSMSLSGAVPKANGNGHHAPAHTPASAPAPVVAPAPQPVVASALHESLAALQRMQEQTALLHKQFLEGQAQTQAAFQRLLEQQVTGIAPAPMPAPVAPTPVVPPAPILAPRAQAAPPSRPMVSTGSVSDRPAALPVAPAPKPAPAPAAKADGQAQSVLLAVVAEKTGYPVEMLQLDMELESDLGIDSIKRVEILSALQEKLPNAPVVKPEHLGTLRTLGQIAEFLAAGTPVAAPAPAAAPSGDAGKVEAVMLAVVAEKTGYPAEMLNLEMELEADLGIDSIKRVEILSALQEQLPGAPVVGPEHLGTLRTLGQIGEFLASGMPADAAPVAAPAVDGGRVERVLMTVVAEKTGYPVEMLNVDMELESDLGIDSIKRVEILSAIQEQLPEAPVVGPEHLGTLRTLRQIGEFLGQGATVAVTPVAVKSDASGVVLEVVAEKTGYPVEMLNLEMELEADLGIDSIKRVEILSALQERLPGSPVVGPEQVGSLRTLAQVCEFLGGAQLPPPQPSPAERGGGPVAEVASPSEGGLSRQVLSVEVISGAREPLRLAKGASVWVAHNGTALGDALVAELAGRGLAARAVPVADSLPYGPAPAGLVVLAPDTADQSLWSEADERFLKAAFAVVQQAGPVLREAGSRSGALLATVSRLDGAFGLRDAATIAPVQGGLAGLAKTAAHEWPEVACKAVDVDARWTDAQAVARALADELLTAGPLEVGLTPAGASTLKLTETPLGAEGPAPLEPGDVVVVSGGARGVTAEAAIALAERYQPTLVLLGRTPEPAPEPDWLAPLQDEPAIKQALMANEAGMSPRQLQDRFNSVMADREVRRNLARVAAAGSRVFYCAADVRDGAAIASVLDEVRRTAGPIRGLVHGAGVLADRLIADKTPEQVDMVLDTKLAGLRALMGALAADELRVLVMFSSVTARRGRTGQVDYAMANEALNKIAQREAARRPACRVLAINWGPWDGGMVTPALKRLFEAEGVGVVPLTEGARYMASELAQPEGPVEVLVMGQLGGSAPAPQPPATTERKLHTAFTRELDARRYPFLGSHVMNGRAVLPVAMIVEWMAHGALHANPGLAFHGIEDVRVFKGVILEDRPYAVKVAASNATKRDGRHEVVVELRGEDKDVLHARATVLLAAQLPAAPANPVATPAVAPYAPGVVGAYRDVLFHGPHFQGIREVEGLSAEGFVAKVATAPAPGSWIAQPLRDAWLADPLVLDAAFQLMILWSVAQSGAPCLPCHAVRYRQFRSAFPAEGVTVVGRVTESTAGRAVAEFVFLDGQGQVVAWLEGAESTVDAALAPAFRRNQLLAGTP